MSDDLSPATNPQSHVSNLDRPTPTPPESTHSSSKVGYLGLGSNRGVRLAHLQAAVDGLAAAEGVVVSGVSPVYATEAHTLDPVETQPPFFNAVVRVDTSLSPEALLALAQRLERAAGRPGASERRRWAPRTLDVDLLVVGDVRRHDDTLDLPHPRLAERRFVLQPLADLAPNLVVPPPFQASVRALLDQCTDTGDLRRTPYVLAAWESLSKPEAEGRTEPSSSLQTRMESPSSRGGDGFGTRSGAG